jgi:hypothetical protein
VWEGDQPSSDADAEAALDELYARYMEREYPTEPSDAISQYVEAPVARWPDLTTLDEAEQDASPWADGPLINNASGPFFYFAMVANDTGGDAFRFAVRAANERGLVCFDPQSSSLAVT